jgi:hypothetical protein
LIPNTPSELTEISRANLEEKLSIECSANQTSASFLINTLMAHLSLTSISPEFTFTETSNNALFVGLKSNDLKTNVKGSLVVLKALSTEFKQWVKHFDALSQFAHKEWGCDIIEEAYLGFCEV